MKRNILLVGGFLFVAMIGFLLNETFVLDPFLDFYYKRNHSASELKSPDPKIKELVTATNNTYGRGKYTTGVRHNGNLEIGCLFYGGYFDIELKTYYYMFANCGTVDFYLRSKEVAKVTGMISLELKAGQARYFTAGDTDTVILRPVTLRLLSSGSMFEFDTNYAKGMLLMPD